MGTVESNVEPALLHLTRFLTIGHRKGPNRTHAGENQMVCGINRSKVANPVWSSLHCCEPGATWTRQWVQTQPNDLFNPLKVSLQSSMLKTNAVISFAPFNPLGINANKPSQIVFENPSHRVTTVS